MNALLSSFDVGAASSALLHWLGQALLYGTVLAVITWVLLSTLCRRATQAVHAALWLIVLVKFLLPVGPSWSYSLAGATQMLSRWWPADTPAGARQPGTGAEGAPQWVRLVSGFDEQPVVSKVESTTSRSWGLPAAAAYLIGVCAVGGIRIWGNRRLAADCRDLPSADGPTRELVREACRRLGARRCPAVRVSDEAPAPFILGVFRPTLVLARRQLERPDELEAVVLHEVAHLRRGDLFVRYLQWIAGTLLFFWPVVAWVNRRIDLAREHACDQWALRHGRLSAGAYARCLLGALHPARSRHWLSRPAAMAANLSTIERRIEMVLNTRNRRRPRGSLGLPGVLLLLAWGGFTLTGAAVADEPGAADNDVEEVVVEQDGKVFITKTITGDGEQTVDVQVRCIKSGDGELSIEVDGDAAQAATMRQVCVVRDATGAGTAEMILFRPLSEQELAEFAEDHPAADADGDGAVSRTEHDAFLIALAMSDPDAVLEQYPMADLDENGELEAGEAARLVSGRMTVHSPVEADAEVEAAEGETEDVEVTIEIEGLHEDSAVAKLRGLCGGKAVVAGADGTRIRIPSLWLLESIDAEPSAAEVAGYLSIVEQPPKINCFTQRPEAAGIGDSILKCIKSLTGSPGCCKAVCTKAKTGKDGDCKVVCIKSQAGDEGNTIIKCIKSGGDDDGQTIIKCIKSGSGSDGEKKIVCIKKVKTDEEAEE